jgi:hypothetical protein
MPSWFVREDQVEFTGRVVSVEPGLAIEPVLWTFSVRPDSDFLDLITTRSGGANPGGTIPCGVGIDPTVAGWPELAEMAANAQGRSAVIVGTWCDDDDTNTTAIRPVGIVAVRHEMEVYEIDGWPIAVRDIDLYGFSHVLIPLSTADDPHVGESRSLSARLTFPMQPSNSATPFWRAYSKTVVDHSDGVGFATDEAVSPVALDVAIETGDPAAGKGFYAAKVGLSFDEPELDQFCPPGTCDRDGKHCSYQGDSRFMRVPPQLPYAKTGDLALSPGDGQGFISLVVASLDPPQVYDHMGIFIDNGRTIRHCTSSKDRVKQKELFTSEITVKLAGVITLDRQKIPLNGFRPDLVKYGWPGAITQTVEEVYRTGRNTLNNRWLYATTHQGADSADPEDPGQPFRIYQLPRSERGRRVEFNDPEMDRSESLVRLQETSVFIGDPAQEFVPLLVRPHPQFEPQARGAAELVAEMAKRIEAHYRYFAYTQGEIGLDPNFNAPPAGDPSWPNTSAAWAADTIGAMCSSFVWTAVQHANDELAAQGQPPILLEDKADPPDPARGLEYGAQDGFYQYHQAERGKAGTNLVNKVMNEVRSSFNDNISTVQYTAVPQLRVYREITAAHVAFQMANAFAIDDPTKIDSWSTNEGETVSPDNVLFFWDLKPHDGRLVQPEDKVAVYGDSVPIQLSPPAWRWVPLSRKQDHDLGTGQVTGIARVAGSPIAGATIRFDFGCETATTTDNREQAFKVTLGAGTHYAEGFTVLPNPVTGNKETFRTKTPFKFEIVQGQLTVIDLDLEPPSDLWRIIDVFLDADVHDRSFWGGDADARHFQIPRQFELRQDLEDDPGAPDDQRNTKLHFEDVWRTEPEVGSGVHVAVSYIADLDPSDRSVSCHCEVALIDTDSGGFLGIGTSSDVDQLERRDVVIPADQTIDVLTDVDFSSNETVPERARVSLRITNRRRPS